MSNFINNTPNEEAINMALNLPEPINSYFTADRGDSEAVAQCFTDNAIVKDEGQTYNGLDAIKQWKKDSSTKYTYTSVPFACEKKDDMTIVSSRVTGNFPGSPVDLRYFFVLDGNKISHLEVIL
jgi:hypothetical protein